MRLVTRDDLGGFAASARGVRALAGVEVTRPFVLLTGPNGSGKSSALRMLRAAPVRACGGDPGKLAAFVDGAGGAGMPDGHPGVLDARALGWRGQRSWLFDSRRETEMLVSSSFHEDFDHHVAMLVGGGTRSSHGEMLRANWTRAICWGLGALEARDPYDDPAGLPPARRALLEAVAEGPRPDERWLLLDEPETAIDGEALFRGSSALLQAAASGRLRVFCASHSPLFAAGMAEHPAVQVLDLGRGGNWFEMQRLLLSAASNPQAIAACAEEVAAAARRAGKAERERAGTGAAAKPAPARPRRGKGAVSGA